MKKRLFEIILFALFGTLMFISKILMEFLPNIHLLAMFITTFTVVYRWKALIPIYIYVFLNGLLVGFSTWWVPYLYVWTVLWLFVMLLPQNMPKRIAVPVYMAVCGLHGILFGVLYAPFQALVFGVNPIAWIMSGIGFDVIHMIGNIVTGTLVFPLTTVLKKYTKSVVK